MWQLCWNVGEMLALCMKTNACFCGFGLFLSSWVKFKQLCAKHSHIVLSYIYIRKFILPFFFFLRVKFWNEAFEAVQADNYFPIPFELKCVFYCQLEILILAAFSGFTPKQIQYLNVLYWCNSTWKCCNPGQAGLSTRLAVVDSSTGSDGWMTDRNTDVNAGLYTDTAAKCIFMHLSLKSDSFNHSHQSPFLSSPRMRR